MTPEELPSIRTPVEPDDLALAFVAAYRSLVQRTPSRDTIVLLLAHSALETARWKSMMCWNIGNIKSRPGDGRCWTFFRCNEVIDGKVVWFDPPHPQTRFRAFHTMTEGAIDHVAFLARSTRYARAWADAIAGRPREYVRALRAGGYFTAALDPYENAVAKIFMQFRTGLTFQVLPDDPVVDDETRARTLALVARTALDETEDFRRGSSVPPDDEPPPTPRNDA